MLRGSKMTPEQCARVRAAHQGPRPYRVGLKVGAEGRRNISEALKGRKPTVKQIETLLFYVTGDKHRSWKGGVSSDKVYRSWQKNLWHHRRRAATGSHTYAEWQAMKAQYKWTCPSCLKSEPEIKLTLDHITPLSKGGSNSIENIQPLCKSCNCRKHTRNTSY